MAEEEFNRIFARRLKYYLEKTGMTQKELAKQLHVGPTSVYNWLHAVKTPRMDKVDAMCELFGCKRSDLIEEKAPATDTLVLTDLEKRIILAYRKMDASGRTVILGALGLSEDQAQEKIS